MLFNNKSLNLNNKLPNKKNWRSLINKKIINKINYSQKKELVIAQAKDKYGKLINISVINKLKTNKYKNY